MPIYQLINPENKTLTVIAEDYFCAIQAAKKLDNYKYSESEYKKKYTLSNLDNKKFKNYSIK